ncbi:hypothetical protein HBA54_11550 [Pelagibius litoralis]|uniref:Uncharacterized protein n=1 Tax=Pelagibius litoralis TaxID=374515 RepID=A0A967KBN4_9PROT|nr:hypothetical protein [Pelagibius litoralis]NIA69225.1 hypothetical protein [Pelagibius litoralis]
MRKLYASVSLALVASLVLLVQAAPILAGPSAVFTNNLDVLVHVDHCASGSTLCTGSSSSGEAAAGNDSIVEVIVHAKRPNGTPFAGLAESAFSLTSITNQGAGVTPVFVGSAICAACFLEVEPGVYRLASRPSFGTWGAGTYSVLLKVTNGNATRQVVVPIHIPN